MTYVERVEKNGKVIDRYFNSHMGKTGQEKIKEENRKKAEQILRNISVMPEDQGKYVILELSQEQLEEAATGLQQLKPIITQQVILGNQKMKSSKEQTEIDVKEVTANLNTALTAMYILLNNLYEGAEP